MLSSLQFHYTKTNKSGPCHFLINICLKELSLTDENYHNALNIQTAK